MNSTIFAYLYPKYTINKQIRLIELFAGIGSQAKALQRIGANFEHYKVVEFDKYAISSYNAIHNTNFPTLDITKIKAEDLEIVDVDKYEYIMTYSFPCQDLSISGLGKGMTKGESTRSGLLWEVERILDECLDLNGNLPQCLLMENVPMIHSEKHVKDFKLWIQKLENLGYKNYIHDLNAKNYGIPQNRDRCFMVSVLGDYSYDFPAYIKLEKCLGDLLEETVDEKYYLSQKMINGNKALNETIAKNNSEDGDFIDAYNRKVKKDVAGTITTRVSESNNTFIVEKLLKEKLCDELINEGLVKEGDVVRHSYTNNRLNNGVENMGRVENKDKLSPTLDTRCDCLGVVVSLKKNTLNYIEWSEDGKLDCDCRAFKEDTISATITTSSKEKVLLNDTRIRKFTPKECWRLMGFDDADYEKASKVNSNAQLYKQAGNSIVVNVLEAIFKEMMEG